MKKLLQNIKSNDIIKELNPFQTEQELVDFMLKLLNTNHIHTVQDFVFRSHNLTKVMADKVVDIINYHALQSYERSLQDDARKMPSWKPMFYLKLFQMISTIILKSKKSKGHKIQSRCVQKNIQ